jgi:hypothetical protein
VHKQYVDGFVSLCERDCKYSPRCKGRVGCDARLVGVWTRTVLCWIFNDWETAGPALPDGKIDGLNRIRYMQYTPWISNHEGSNLSYGDGHSKFVPKIGGQTGPDLARPIVGRGLAVGDFDNDGRLDVLVVDSEGAPLLLHNKTAPVGHWLLVKLVGTQSNRDGTGGILNNEMIVYRTAQVNPRYLIELSPQGR